MLGTYSTFLVPFDITYRWELECVGELLFYIFGHDQWTSEVHSQKTSSVSSFLYMFCCAFLIGVDLARRDRLNIERSGLITGQEDVCYGYRKKYLELNMLRLL